MYPVYVEGEGFNSAMKRLLATKLSHTYGGRLVLHDLDLEVNPGEVVGLLGPNGAGKSTAIGLISGVVPVQRGSVQLDGHKLDGMRAWERVREGLAYLPQDASVLRNCTVRENLLIAADVGGFTQEQVDHQIEGAGLDSVAHQRAGLLSGGERRRLEIARCLMTNPQVFLMDEPFAGVDPVGIEGIQQTILELAAGGMGVLLTDHAVHATLRVCDRAIILDQGTVMAMGCPEEIVANQVVRDRYLGSEFFL